MNNKKRCCLFVIAILMIISLIACGKGDEEEYRVVKLEKYDGNVILNRGDNVEDIFEGMQLKIDDTVTTGTESRAELLVDSDKHIVASADTSFILSASGNEEQGKVKIDLLYGNGLFTIDNKLADGSEFIVNTPNASLSVRGTVFSVSFDKETNTTYVDVSEGVVWIKGEDTEKTLEAGDSATINDEGLIVTSGNIDADNADIEEEDENQDTLDSFTSSSADSVATNVGETVTFGTFEGNPIEWDVLENDGESMLLISHTILTNVAYDQAGVDMLDMVDTNWEQSEIRTYLNGEFYDTSFSLEEQEKIQTVINTNPSTRDFFYLHAPGYYIAENTNSCGDTEDKVFLLSSEELVNYYGVETRANYYLYSDASIMENASEDDPLQLKYWWLRSEGQQGGYAALVVTSYNGLISDYEVTFEAGVRPVIRVNF